MTLFEPTVDAGASISEDGLYRYHLWRNLPAHIVRDLPTRTMLFVMLNPSTADATADDATIRRCLRFAAREHCTRLEVVNLFAWRATDPRELGRAKDPVGPDNLGHVQTAIAHADVVVAAWGNWRPVMEKSMPIRLTVRSVPGVVCLGTTASDDPRHPLYIAKTAPLLPYSF